MDALQPVAGVELHGGHVGVHLHDAAGGGLAHFGGEGQLVIVAGVEVEVVVIAVAVGELLVLVGQGHAVADAPGLAQVKGRAAHGAHLAGGDALFVGNDGEGVGVDLDHMVFDGAAALAREVEVGVVGEVAEGVLVGNGLVVDGKLVVIVEGVGDHDLQGAGVALLAVRGGVLEDEAVLADALDGGHVPQLAVEADVAAVQVGDAALVFGQRQFLAAHDALAVGDAVAHAADERAQIAAHGLIAGHVPVAENDVAQLALAVGHVDGADDAAVVGDLHGSAGRVGEDVEIGGFAALQSAEGYFANAHGETTSCMIFPFISYIERHGFSRRKG